MPTRMPENVLPTRGAALLFGLVLAVLLFRLGAVPLVGPDEPRYARVAVEMKRSGDLVTPRLSGEPWLEKPALYYWLAAAAYSVLGENETAARLPSVAAALLFVGATAVVASRLYGAAAGLHAGFILGTALLPFAYGRAAAMDMLLAAMITASLGFLGLRFLGIAGRLSVPAAYAAVALATLAKGPIGVLLPGLVVVAYAAARRDARVLLRALSIPGIVIFLLIAAPWYVSVWLAQGQTFVEVFFLNHNLQRFTSTIHNHPGPFYYYAPLLIAGFFPWSGLLLPGLFGLRPRQDRADLWLLLWFAMPFLFFSAAGSKLPGYILPCLPPLAIAMGRAADRLVRGLDVAVWRRPVALVGLALGALIVTGPLVLRSQGERLWPAALPPCLWALVVTFVVSRRMETSPAGALALLRVGAAGLLLLVAHAAPPLLAARESGRDLFGPAAGRPVLAWNAWRTAWMSGYFYNDGKVREIESFREVQAGLERGPVLLLCGPEETRRLGQMPSLRATPLARGPRATSLLKVEVR